MSAFFKAFDQEEISRYINIREGEVKFGERVQAPAEDDWLTELNDSDALFVWVGIPEDIGVRANGGIGGAQTAPEAGLKAILNIQNTERLPGSKLLMLGQFQFESWMKEAETANPATLSEIVHQIDIEVAGVIEQIVRAKKIPIVVGGGHNNCYGLISGTSIALKLPINSVNLDAHSDFRRPEGRHSGNGFRYARQDGYLDAYAIVGLHENYNSQEIVNELKSDSGIHYSCFEDIYVRKVQSFDVAVRNAFAHVSDGPTGIELDLDSIEGMLASAATPSGVPMADARSYAWRAGRECQPAYLHLTEGVAERRDGLSNPLAGKTIAYLASDFMKGYLDQYR
jgi:formiminoglutamase